MENLPKFNLNDIIYFKLTKRGQEYIKVLNESHAVYKFCPLKFHENAEGYCYDELWHFASIFGPTLYNGCDSPVEMTIYIKNN